MPPKGGWVDDVSLTADTVLWRGVVPLWLHTDPLTGKQHADSAAFKDGELSVHIASETKLEDLQGLLPPGSRIAELTVGDVRAEGCIIVRHGDPPDLPGHCVVGRADQPGKYIGGGQARRLRNKAKWIDGD